MMINETLGFEKMEISDMIRELRIEKKISQDVLYAGLCGRKKYFQLENGDAIMDELLSERLFSRLHVQYHLVDIMLDDDNFWQKECRHEINLQIRKKDWDMAEKLLAEYEEKAPQEAIHKQYVKAKRAEIQYHMENKDAGKLFQEALEITMPVAELEARLKNSGVISDEELWMYLRYRNVEKPFTMEEQELFLGRIEEWFLSVQIYAEAYFEAAYQYGQELLRTEQYVLCRKVCRKIIAWLKRGVKHYHLESFYFLDAMAGMRLKHSDAEERELFQQCKMAYYVAVSCRKREVAEEIKKQCEEEFGWHIIG